MNDIPTGNDAGPARSRLWVKIYAVRRNLAVGALALVTLTGFVAYTPVPQRTIVAFGDSYFSGYGLDPTNSFPVQFEKALRAHGHRARVINEGVPGETIADGLKRLDKTLASKPDLIILELGANDAEQGLDPTISKANLDLMLNKIKTAHVRVLLCGAGRPDQFWRGIPGVVRPDLSADGVQTPCTALPLHSGRGLVRCQPDPRRWRASERQGRAGDGRSHPAGCRASAASKTALARPGRVGCFHETSQFMATFHPRDRPIWSALTTRQSHIALGTKRALLKSPGSPCRITRRRGSAA